MHKLLQKRWFAPIGAVICTLLWGTAYPVIKYGYAQLNMTAVADKLMFAGLRFFLSGVMVLLVAWVRNRRFPAVPRGRIGGVLLYGVLQTGLMYLFNYIGVANTTATKTSVLTAASAFFAVILAPLFFKGERLTALKVIGVMVGMAGIILVNTDALGGFSLMGEGLVLLSTLLNTAGSFVGKRVSGGIIFEATAYQLMTGGAMLLLCALPTGSSYPLTAESLWLVLYLAFVSAAAFTLWTALLVYHEAGQILVFNMMIPVTGAVWSFFILGERQIFDPMFLLSVLLTAAGIILVNLRTNKEIIPVFHKTR